MESPPKKIILRQLIKKKNAKKKTPLAWKGSLAMLTLLSNISSFHFLCQNFEWESKGTPTMVVPLSRIVVRSGKWFYLKGNEY